MECAGSWKCQSQKNIEHEGGITSSITTPKRVKLVSPTMVAMGFRYAWPQRKHVKHHSWLFASLDTYYTVKDSALIVVHVLDILRPPEQGSCNLDQKTQSESEIH